MRNTLASIRRSSGIAGITLGIGLFAVLVPSEAQAAESSLLGQVSELLVLRHNTRMVLLGTTALGVCGGIVGVFMLLRRRSLVGDVVGHSALPGIALAFLLAELTRPGEGKTVPFLLAGALAAGLIGALSVMLIDRFSRIKADAAMAVVLSLFYGAGSALLTVIQKIPGASAAGLDQYLLGKTAAIVAGDVWIFAGAATLLSLLTWILFKEFCLLCFDDEFAAATGWPVFWLDTLLTGLVVGVTIIGMQSVGLLLVVASLIIPAAAARFWTERIARMTVISAAIGGVSALCGTIFSALLPRVAAGAAIVLSGTALFLFSFCFGRQRGIIWKWVAHRRLQHRIGRHDLLRACYELVESAHQSPDLPDAVLIQQPIDVADLERMRAWSHARVLRLLANSEDKDVLKSQDGSYRLTPAGAALARRAVRDHRLWEMYLITYAEIAPSHVDRDADQIEHVLDPEVIRELELRLSDEELSRMPASPHPLDANQESTPSDSD